MKIAVTLQQSCSTFLRASVKGYDIVLGSGFDRQG